MKLIVNCESGETTLRELNAEELAQKVIDEANIQAATTARQAEAEAKAAAQAKLTALGLTVEDLQALGL